MSLNRTRWAAIGAAIAVTLGAGGLGLVSATQPGSAVTFVPITPCRVIDTRVPTNVGPRATPLGPGETYTVNTTTGNTGQCTGIPTTATGVSLNVTPLEASISTFLTIWATGAAQPNASSLNPTPGEPPTPNAVTTGINAGGQFSIFNLQGNVEVIADINGYYVDHNHDDRYYTKSAADDRYLGFGETLLSAVTSGGATRSGSAVSFPDTGSPVMTISFGLPSGRDRARPILVQIPFSGPPNCSFVLSADGIAGPFFDTTRFFNAGWSVVGSPSGIVSLGPNPPGASSSTTIVTLAHSSPDQLGGGASVEMNLVRSGANANDTCAGAVIARGGFSVAY